MLYRTLALRDIRDDAAASVSHALRLGVVLVCLLLEVKHWYSRRVAGLVGGVVGALGGDCAAGRGAGVGAGQALSTRDDRGRSDGRYAAGARSVYAYSAMLESQSRITHHGSIAYSPRQESQANAYILIWL